MKQQRILVEGNDFHVIVQVCIKHGLKRPLGFPNQKDFERDFLIKNKRGESLGKKDLLNEIPRVVISAGVKTFGIVIDADKSATSTWQSVCAALQKSGYSNLPIIPDANGTIIIDSNPDLPKVSIWIMPDNQHPGEIEDFFLQLIDDKGFHLQHAREIVGNMITQKQNLFADSDRSKAEAHTWLAWQEEPGKSMGLAVKSNWVNAEHPLATRFATWFSQLFELED